ncbi:MAG: B12-binding domain-containing radical SAM protein, partial [Methanobrevibacter sp.]|nr:B12-binding domain-containing radical SAM protein [Candidatus Methanovirga australis]
IIQAKKENKKLEKLILGERIENLDELNFINRDIFPKERVNNLNFQLPFFSIMTSRVCLYNCKFCQPSSKTMFGTKLRVRSPEHVVKELLYLKDKYMLKSFYFIEDNVLQDREWIIKFIECCKSTNFKATFMMLGRSNNIIKNEDLIGELYEIGLREVFIGFESGSDKMLKEFNKGINVKTNEKSIQILNKYQIKVDGGFIFGFPFETKEDMKLTESFIKKNDIDYLGLSTFIPYPGTYFAKEYKEKGLLYNPENVDVKLYKPKIKGINYYRVVWMIFKLNFKYQFSKKTSLKFIIIEFLTLLYYFSGITIFYIQYFLKR